MKLLTLRYTPEALAELEQVLNGIAEHSPPGARNVLRRINTTIELLTTSPYRGRLTSLPPMRRIVATPYTYLIFYEPTDDEIVVIGVRHGARGPSSMPGRS